MGRVTFPLVGVVYNLIHLMMSVSSKGDILKVRLGDDTRRLVLYNTHISYDDLVLMLQRIYNGQLKSSDDVTLKYYDDGMFT